MDDFECFQWHTLGKIMGLKCAADHLDTYLGTHDCSADVVALINEAKAAYAGTTKALEREWLKRVRQGRAVTV